MDSCLLLLVERCKVRKVLFRIRPLSLGQHGGHMREALSAWKTDMFVDFKLRARESS